MAAEPTKQPQNVAQAVAEVSERASLLIREEIELAKAEVSEKLSSLAKAGAVGVASGFFIAIAFFFFLEGLAWFISSEVFGDTWGGFFVLAAILLGIGCIAGLIAARVVRRGPPTPVMAIDEARKIRESITAEAQS